MADESVIKGAVGDVSYSYYSSGEWLRTSTSVPQEMALTIFIDNEELVTILCTPTKINCLVLGFLYSEGIINGMGDVASMRVCEDDSLADVRLSNSGYIPPTRRTLGSGCGGGVSFTPRAEKVNSDLVVTPEEALSLMRQMNERAELYHYCGGVHTTALGDTKNLLIVAEDIGRHNTLDKVMGECLLTKQSPKDHVLVATGRISSEMLIKAARMEIPVVISRSSPTDRAISLAQELGITLIGYVRGKRLSVYSHGDRVQGHSELVTAN
ncbi:MAG: formate dehydrogenase accessory sulfurtransferase FdhD [Chloroflexota bacterium]|nr:formate dehydrogenase accessory sulfurtransferase FdhD [Chloroflexota bacterium]